MVDTLTRTPTSPASVRSGRPRSAEGGPRWGLVVVLWATLVLSLASLQPLFQGASWWLTAAFVAALVSAAAAGARALGWRPLVATAVGAVVGALASTAVASGGTAVLGVFPSAATVERIRLLVGQARDTIVGDQAPIPVQPSMLFVVVVAVAAAAVLIDLVAHVGRMPGLSGVVLVVVLVVPSFVPDVAPNWLWVVLAVIGYVAVLVVSTGRRLSRGALVTGVAAVAVAGVVTSVLPVSLVSPVTGLGTGIGISTGVNPVIDLGKDLRRGAPVTVLTYTTSAPQGTYLKLVDLVDFSGTTWSPASVRLDSRNSVDRLPAAPGIASATTRDTVTTDVAVSLLRSPYLPLPVPATTVTGIDDRWKYVDSSGVTIRSATEGSQGLDYKVTSRPVDPTPEQISASLGTTPADLAPYLKVDGVPASITSLAKRVTATASNRFDAAVDLQTYFRNGDFTYSEDTPVRGGYDGSGLDMVETFLQRKSGYCVHFASAMAVMARTLGIPSRIAVGFLPGDQVSPGSSSAWTVTSDDLHTWPELYFQGLGWIPFEPTVSLGTTSSYLQQTGTEPTAAPSTSAQPTAEPTTPASAPASSAATATPTTDASGSSSAQSPTSTALDGAQLGLPLGIAVLVLLALVPWWLRVSRRRRRLGQGPPDAALSAWLEVVDTARDLGLPVDPGATPQSTSALLDEALSRSGGRIPVRAALADLLAAVQAERFGGREADVGVHDDARTVIDGLRAASPVPVRVRATVAPRSLFAEQRPRPAE
ncbi:transglutaminase family protein [Frondihabitans sp. 762G35]|uniref:transglutaminase family protein n=1 Tax=Frondihabitans sp. 762G35 TaxID=1446794 RepID=UPI000F4DD9BC|nr:DUF3488 and transglutaminase-like domain-containing protein [Frondihabitans sp. 762G35]